MNTRWELVVSLAREVDEDCALGRKPDLTRVARLARAVIEFQQGLVGPVKARSHGLRGPDSSGTVPTAAAASHPGAMSDPGPVSDPGEEVGVPPAANE